MMDENVMTVTTVVFGVIAAVFNLYMANKLRKEQGAPLSGNQKEHFEIRNNERAIAVDMTGFSPDARAEIQKVIGQTVQLVK
jgi:hypothetical protein